MATVSFSLQLQQHLGFDMDKHHPGTKCTLNRAALAVAEPLGEDSAGEFCRGTYRGEEVTAHKVVVLDESKFCAEIASAVGYSHLLLLCSL